LIDGATAVFVVNADGARYRARNVGVTNRVDIALLQIEPAAALPRVRFGDSDNLHVGDRVVTIGSPLRFDNTVTSGIIGAANRDISENPFDGLTRARPGRRRSPLRSVVTLRAEAFGR
jgi:S1-C subfamily serine protease